MTGWAAFWIMCAVFITAEAVIYLNGHDTLLWRHKSQAELQIQSKSINGGAE